MRKITIIVVTTAVLAVAVLAFHFGKWAAEDKSRQNRYLSESRFAQIRLALLNYHADYGRFPPTKYQAEPNGPIHSWRMLVFPYIDIDTRRLYSKYNFSEDWNSHGNLAIARSALSLSHVFSFNDDDRANYLAIGAGEEWPSDRPLRSRLLTKGSDQFLLIEYADSDIFWTDPRY